MVSMTVENVSGSRSTAVISGHECIKLPKLKHPLQGEVDFLSHYRYQHFGVI